MLGSVPTDEVCKFWEKGYASGAGNAGSTCKLTGESIFNIPANLIMGQRSEGIGGLSFDALNLVVWGGLAYLLFSSGKR